MKTDQQEFNFTNPPEQLNKAKLDNIALVPASLLPFKKQYQEVANNLPQGSILICIPNTKSNSTGVFEKMAAFLQNHNQQVKIVSAGMFG